MDLTISLAAVTIIGTFSGIAGYFLMRAKYKRELAKGRSREAELATKVYETAVLKEISERIGYSLDANKIIEIISGSLGQLLPYSTVSHMILKDDRISFVTNVNESVAHSFINDVRGKMLAALSEMLMEVKLDVDVDESVSGAILDELDTSPVASFFNLPIVISGKLAGIINVASKTEGLYVGDDTAVLYRIAIGASEAVSRLQEVLEEEKGKLAAAVESLSDGVLMVDKNYQLIVANKKLRQLLGTIESPKIFDIVNALAGTFDLRTKMEEVMSGAEPVAPFEIVLHDKVLAVSAARVSGQRRQKPIGLVVLFHDITDAKALEKLRQDFMAMMVHELRSPLTSIKSTVAMIKSAGVGTLSAEDLGKYLETVASTSETMLELVNDLLDVAKVEAGKFDIVCDRGDLGEVILERIESFKPQMAARGLAIEADIEKDLPRAWFDKVRIKQVMNNLLSNAIKYTDAGTVKVLATVEKVSGAPIDILVSVADTGIGIEADQAEKLFSKFGQLESGRGHAELKSSGLGLYITKKIVEAVGGKIWVESAGAGAGSTFFFTVPLAATAKRDQAGQNVVVPQGQGSLKNFTTTKVGQ